MSDLKVQISKKVFNDAYHPHLENLTPLQIFFGGSGSGKSVFLAQRAVYDILKGGRNYLVCRAVGKTTKKSVFQELKKIIKAWKLSALFRSNESDQTITCKNGYQIIISGLDDPEKLKSITPAKGVLTDIWIEEATEVDENTVKDLDKRLRGGSEDIIKRIILSFNPIFISHWIFKRHFKELGWADNQKEYKSSSVFILKTTYKDNRFLTQQDTEKLENESDKYYYNVYTLGNWGVLGNVIFTNWRIEDLSDRYEQFVNLRNGLDFGFSTDPAAVGRSHYDKTRKTIYFLEELYETGLTNDVLAERIIDMMGVWSKPEDESAKPELIGTERIICDSAEPKSIAELRRYKVDAHGAKKGKDSVVHGIQWLQQQTIIVDKRCVNMQNELQTYKWKEDAGGMVVKSGGLPVPLDRNNHLIDGGLRYAYEDDMLEMNVETVENPFYN